MTTIIADSTCDLNQDLLKGYNLKVLPLSITLQEKTYLDGIDIQIDKVYEAMRKGIMPKTAQIPYEYIFNAFDECSKAGEDFIYLSFSKEMSSCYSLATVIANELQELYPDVRMSVVDSRGGSSATGLIVLQALRLAKAGMEYDTLLKDIQFMIDHVEHVFSLADLEWMAKGGRISKPLGFIGSKINLRPWLDVEGGKMIVKGMVRGRNKAINIVAKELVKRAERFPEQLIAITHADDLPSALELETQIKNMLPICKTTLCHIGGILGVHIGISGIGAFCFNERVPDYLIVDPKNEIS